MRIIKRYSNRKLYDPSTRKYVTLDDIGKMVKAGDDVKVEDKATGEDLTSITLSQVLLEKEKKHQSSLPKQFFTTVLQSGAKIKDALFEKGGRLLGDRVQGALASLKIPTRAEFDALAKSVAEMEKALKRIEKRLK